MHILCNSLRVLLGILVVSLVGESLHFLEMTNLIDMFYIFLDVQVSCITHVDHYIPPLWIMCTESVAHLMVMLNFSSNFLIYCSVSKQFKLTLSKAFSRILRIPTSPTVERSHTGELETVALPTLTPLSELSVHLIYRKEMKKGYKTFRRN